LLQYSHYTSIFKVLEHYGVLVLIHSVTLNFEMGPTFLTGSKVFFFYFRYISKTSCYFHLVDLGLFVPQLGDTASDLMISSDEPNVSDQINTFSFPSVQHFQFVSWPNLFISFFLFSFPASSLFQLPLYYPAHEICQLSPGNLITHKNIITLAAALRQGLIHSQSN
jgi:hypothetical protein